jgi:NAD(P)H-dependent FMN reductase
MNRQSLKMRVLLLCGSLHYPSHTYAILKQIENLLRLSGARTYLWDLLSSPLPITIPRYFGNPHRHKFEVVRRLARLSEFADAFVWGTPVYHNSFSGILKNALDNLNAEQFRNKPIALISNGGVSSNGGPCEQLCVVARSLQAVVLPDQIMTADADFEYYQGQFVLVNPLHHDRFVRLAQDLITYSISLRQLRSDGF